MAETGSMLTIVLIIPLLILIILIVAIPLYFFVIRKNRQISQLQGQVEQLQIQNEQPPQ
ncbi:MAG: hypothetical protein QGI58_02635 [Candidatus Thalassarchaeaceae archaeon]|nr:hypothetical protein [Candidatus Thalassarchaeaceae archaeon]